MQELCHTQIHLCHNQMVEKTPEAENYTSKPVLLTYQLTWSMILHILFDMVGHPNHMKREANAIYRRLGIEGAKRN